MNFSFQELTAPSPDAGELSLLGAELGLLIFLTNFPHSFALDAGPDLGTLFLALCFLTLLCLQPVSLPCGWLMPCGTLVLP